MIQISPIIFYSILEVIIVLLIVCIFLYLRVRKYKPYYLANTEPEMFFRHYLDQALEFTRQHAHSLEAQAEAGNRRAIMHRQNLVARLNWLVLEKDFLAVTKPDEEYWDDMNQRITRLLDQWDLVGFIDGRPSEKTVTRALSAGDIPPNDLMSDSDFLPDINDQHQAAAGGEHGSADLAQVDEQTKARIAYLERQVHQLDSYKSMFFGLQKTYESTKGAYKKMKNQLFSLQLEADQAEKLKNIIQEHESTENTMEDQMKSMEDSKQRLNDELKQIEALYNLKLDEEEKVKRNKQVTAESLNYENPSDDMIEFKDIMDLQEITLRELTAAILELNMDVEKKMAFEDMLEKLTKQNQELLICMKTLDMGREHLKDDADLAES